MLKHTRTCEHPKSRLAPAPALPRAAVRIHRRRAYCRHQRRPIASGRPAPHASSPGRRRRGLARDCHPGLRGSGATRADPQPGGERHVRSRPHGWGNVFAHARPRPDRSRPDRRSHRSWGSRAPRPRRGARASGLARGSRRAQRLPVAWRAGRATRGGGALARVDRGRGLARRGHGVQRRPARDRHVVVGAGDAGGRPDRGAHLSRSAQRGPLAGLADASHPHRRARPRSRWAGAGVPGKRRPCPVTIRPPR